MVIVLGRLMLFTLSAALTVFHVPSVVCVIDELNGGYEKYLSPAESKRKGSGLTYQDYA